MDKDEMLIIWPETKEFYAFADDGSGNHCIVRPTDTVPEVFFHDHEIRERVSLGAQLSEFISAKRIQYHES
jgi:hypothetical protein